MTTAGPGVVRRQALWWMIGLLALGPARGSATVLDWSAVSWPAGSLAETLTGIDPNNPGSSINVSITGDTAAFVNGYPVNAAAPFTGGSGGDTNLQLLLRFPNPAANITVTVKFNYGGAGVQDVNFSLFNIDKLSRFGFGFDDQISSISGQFGTNAPVAAIITNIPGSPSYSVADNGTLGATITGTSYAANNSNNGNATIDFGTNLIDQFSFTLGNAVGVTNPLPQGIGLFDINFTPMVPEVAPGKAAVLLCGLVLAWRTLRSRRATSTAPGPSGRLTGR